MSVVQHHCTRDSFWVVPTRMSSVHLSKLLQVASVSTVTTKSSVCCLVTVTLCRVIDSHSRDLSHLLIKICKVFHSSVECVILHLSPRSYNPSQGTLWFLQCPKWTFLLVPAGSAAAFPQSHRRVRFVLPATHDDTVNKWLISHSVLSCTKYNYMMSKM